ncbi:transcriptional regulator, TetR family [Nocardioides szechwanensis]|uniref:Transcriptional regulator, TetR family n=1 Tax=Nocardioides szechwanensis TaxID=1005944 RepID=A0A1H0JXJ1_9ACTN|nr:TetR/AcrR family transcriptional regulator [Nocardioides szechwanensis]SDO48508.1 transcriptional regulator, TetR family [Nocardioides szechwanensis]
MSSGETDGRSSRWNVHRTERRAELVAAAVTAIDTHGPDVSMAQIASEAGVSKPVLYRYFADKHELHAAVGQWGADEVLRRVVPAMLADGPVRDKFAGAIDGYLSMIEEHHQLFVMLVRHRPGGDPLADGKVKIVSTLAHFLSETLRGLGLDDSGAEVWAQGIVGSGLAIGEWWLETRTMTREQVGGYLSSFAWHSMEGTARELGMPLSVLDA